MGTLENIFVAFLLPVCICVLLPVLIMWLVSRIEMNRNNRRAAVIAASVGFVMGMLFALAIPWVLGAISSIEMPRVEILTLPAADIVRVALWCLTGGVAVVSAINAYDVSLALMRRKKD